MNISGTSEPIFESSPALRNKSFVTGLVVVSLILFFLMWLSAVTDGLFHLIDEPINRFFIDLNQNAPEWVDSVGDIFVRAGSQGLTVVAIILLAVMAFRRQFREFWLLFASVAGGELLWLPLIFAVDRPRPTEVRAISGLVLPGFPSGHVMIFVAFFGALLYIYFIGRKNPPWRRTIVAVVLFLFLLTGANRLYFGAHYFTDIIAGYALGIAWTAFALTAVDWLWLKRQSRNRPD